MKNLILLVFISGCSCSAGISNNEHMLPGSIEKIVDYEQKIVCYGYYQRAISCLPLRYGGEAK